MTHTFHEYQKLLHFLHKGTIVTPTSFNSTSVGDTSV